MAVVSGCGHQLMLGTDLFVDMFFVLSALVLWLPIARSCADGGAGRPGRVLLLRRMARLLPLYVRDRAGRLGVHQPDACRATGRTSLTHLTFTHVYSDDYIFWTDGPAWSLAVEFHFYLLMALAVPFVNRAAKKRQTRRGRLAVASVLPALCLAIGARLPRLGDRAQRTRATPGRSGSPRSRAPPTSASAWDSR